MTYRNKQIILHIGTEKTGTTSIQRMLFENKDIFKKKGFYFLQSPGEKNNRKLSVFSMGENRIDDYTLALGIPDRTSKNDFDNTFVRELREEIQKIPESIHTVIASSEHLHSRLLFKNELEKLKDLLNQFFSEIKIVCYFRRQDDLLNSLYSTILKSGGDQSFNLFFKNYVISDSVILNYLKSMDMWNEVFFESEIQIRPFTRSSFIEGCLITDFLTTVGMSKLINYINLPDQENESIDCIGQALLRLYNQKKNTGQYMTQNRMPIQWVNKYRQGRCNRLNRQQIQTLNNFFFQTNLDFQQKYLPTGCELFSQKFEFKQVKTDPIESSVIDFLEFLMGSDGFEEMDSEQKQVDLIRDVAIFFEHKDLEISLELMNVAAKLRPSGKLIQKKVTDYQALLNKK